MHKTLCAMKIFEHMWHECYCAAASLQSLILSNPSTHPVPHGVFASDRQLIDFVAKCEMRLLSCGVRTYNLSEASACETVEGTRSSATAKSTARPSCLVYFMTFLQENLLIIYNVRDRPTHWLSTSTTVH